jgi:rhamnosyltransferase
MSTQPCAKVAVLLATHNGERFLEPQIRSLKENATPFAIHWVDDHSTDNTRNLVRALAEDLGVELHEWHVPQRLGVPGVFFELIERADADIYLFCDQDDIWQPGKIDAIVANLMPDLAAPVLCFSDCLVFKDEEPERVQRLAELRGVRHEEAHEESRVFTYHPATGHTNGFTRPLREIFLKHKHIARNYTHGHDYWMYLIACASGTARMLPDVPTTLYRLHGNNVFGMSFVRHPNLMRHVRTMWRFHQLSRWRYARQAEGFILAAQTLQPGPKLDRMIGLAEMVMKLKERQSPLGVLRLLRVMPPIRERTFWFTITCLCTRANV